MQRVQTMSVKPTDAQILMLSAAARRKDRILVMPPNLKGAAAHKVATKLIAAGLVKEIKAKTGAPAWRRDEATEQSFALKLTAAGLKASVSEVTDAAIEAARTAAAPAQPIAATIDSTEAASAPREGTKIANVLELLQRDEGATLDEVIAATGWLPHTSRAALTGLRKRGYGIERRPRAEGARAYAINVARLA
jgi:Protein of unknown function (DUF3489)